MENIREQLTAILGQAGFALTAEQTEKFQTYFEVLLDWNHKINLTSITESVKIIEKHFLDSIMLLKFADIGQGASFADVGTGAGFPGVPLKILRPDIELTLMDSLNKRVLFLEELCGVLQIEAEAVHIRAEEAGRDPIYREAFNFVSARAVADLRILSEYCLPLVKNNGYFLAMKGPNMEEELAAAKNAIFVLGAKTKKVEHFALPSGDERTVVLIQKHKKTPAVYPRHGGAIAKKSL